VVRREEPDGGNELIHAFRRELAFLQQVQSVLANGFRIELLGRAAEILGKLGYIADVALLGAGGEIAQLHVFDHALPKWCHAMAP
jgi:hypothetical protein